MDDEVNYENVKWKPPVYDIYESQLIYMGVW